MTVKMTKSKIRQSADPLPTMLYLENDLMTTDVISKFLKKVGVVESVSNGPEALAKITSKQYDVILVDINLGNGMNGNDFTRLVREIPVYKNTPIIAVTACAMFGDREECLAAGCSDYIAKPFRRQELVGLVKKALNS